MLKSFAKTCRKESGIRFFILILHESVVIPVMAPIGQMHDRTVRNVVFSDSEAEQRLRNGNAVTGDADADIVGFFGIVDLKLPVSAAGLRLWFLRFETVVVSSSLLTAPTWR